MRNWTAIIILFVVSAQAQTENVYVDALGSGWDNWSWSGTYYFTNNSPVYTGSASIKLTQTANGGLSLHHASIASNAYSWLSFYTHGGTRGGQLLSVSRPAMDVKAQ